MNGTYRRTGCVLVVAALLAGSRVAGAVQLRAGPPMLVDGRGAGFRQPEGVACGGGALVVADTGNGRLVRYTVEGDLVRPRDQIALAELPYPIRVRLDPRGDVLALDGKTRRIVRVSPAGGFAGFVEPDPGLGQVIPRSFDVDAAGRVWVLDSFSGRVLALDAEGRARRRVALPRPYGFVSDVAVSAQGGVFLIDSVEAAVYLAGPRDTTAAPFGGALPETVSFPTSLVADRRGRLFVLDQNGGSISILSPQGSRLARQSGMGWNQGSLRYPSGLCVDGANLFVADRENNRIQPFLIAE